MHREKGLQRFLMQDLCFIFSICIHYNDSFQPACIICIFEDYKNIAARSSLFFRRKIEFKVLLSGYEGLESKNLDLYLFMRYNPVHYFFKHFMSELL
jgi:hypothetical protein